MKLPEQLGPYKLGQLLGRGGMGAVYEAVNLETGESAAIKVLTDPTSDAQPGFRIRFESEIETLRKLRHKNIVRLVGFGRQDDLLFYTMELVRGRSLQVELRDGRRFSWRQTVNIALALCQALRHAHDRGVVHRDIKPANILLVNNGATDADTLDQESSLPPDRIKLSDFGIAQLFGCERITSVGAVVGTIEFMAPEQASARPVGPKADLYSLGAVLYTLLARRPPFIAKSLPEIISQHRESTPEPIVHFNPAVPSELDWIISRLLQINPKDRPTNVDLLRRQLESMLFAIEAINKREQSDSSDLPLDQDDEQAPATGDNPTRPDETPRSIHEVETRQTSALTPLKGRDDDDQLFELTTNEATGDSDAEFSDALDFTRTASVVLDVDDSNLYDSPGEQPTEEGTLDPDSPVSDTPPAGNLDGTDDELELPKTVTSRYTSVRADELDPYSQATPQETTRAALMSGQTWALILALVSLGLTAWYFLQPPSADKLYDRISRTISDKTLSSYRAAENNMNRFITRFPNDSRSTRLREFLWEVELDKQERRFERRIGDLSNPEVLLPVERACLEALSIARSSPEHGVLQLQAVVDLYAISLNDTESGKNLNDPTALCVELARRRLEQLTDQLSSVAQQESELISSKLERAKMLDSTDPQRAEAIRRAIFVLYGDKPWAEPLLDPLADRPRSSADVRN